MIDFNTACIPLGDAGRLSDWMSIPSLMNGVFGLKTDSPVSNSNATNAKE
jgi:hypothetical protein